VFRVMADVIPLYSTHLTLAAVVSRVIEVVIPLLSRIKKSNRGYARTFNSPYL
jgi:hypothetical protein